METDPRSELQLEGNTAEFLLEGLLIPKTLVLQPQTPLRFRIEHLEKSSNLGMGFVTSKWKPLHALGDKGYSSCLRDCGNIYENRPFNPVWRLCGPLYKGDEIWMSLENSRVYFNINGEGYRIGFELDPEEEHFPAFSLLNASIKFLPLEDFQEFVE